MHIYISLYVSAHSDIPKGPCTSIVHTLFLKGLLYPTLGPVYGLDRYLELLGTVLMTSCADCFGKGPSYCSFFKGGTCSGSGPALN